MVDNDDEDDCTLHSMQYLFIYFLFIIFIYLQYNCPQTFPTYKYGDLIDCRYYLSYELFFTTYFFLFNCKILFHTFYNTL